MDIVIVNIKCAAVNVGSLRQLTDRNAVLRLFGKQFDKRLAYLLLGPDYAAVQLFVGHSDYLHNFLSVL